MKANKDLAANVRTNGSKSQTTLWTHPLLPEEAVVVASPWNPALSQTSMET